MVQDQKHYYAFISYKREDEKWAKWLQEKLEHYRFPTNLNGRTDLPKNIRPTFRDVTDLEPGILSEKIDAALRDSQWLIVICSPRSAKSPWVSKEAQTFIDLGRADHIIPFIIEGIPQSNNPVIECYPDAISNLPKEQELLGANINEMGRDAAAIKVVARMFGLKFDALWQRHIREKQKRIIYISTIALCLISLLSYLLIRELRHSSVLTEKNVLIEKRNQEIQEINQKMRIANDSLLLLNEAVSHHNISLTNTIIEYEFATVEKFLAEERSLNSFFACRHLWREYSNFNGLSESRLRILYRKSLEQLQKKRITPLNERTDSATIMHFKRKVNESLLSPDKSIRAWLGDYEIVVEDNRSNKTVYQKEDHNLCGVYVGLSGIISISKNNRYIVAHGISRIHSALSIIDILQDKLTVISEAVFSNDLDYSWGAFSTDNQLMAISGEKAGIKIIEIESLSTIYSLNDIDLCCKFGEKNDELILYSSKYNDYYEFKINDKKHNEKQIVIEESLRIFGLSLSPDNKTLAVATNKGLQIWDISTNQRIRTILKDEEIYCVEFSHDGNFIAIELDGDLCYLPYLNETELIKVDIPRGNTCNADMYKVDIIFSPDDNYIGYWHAGYGFAIYSICERRIIHEWKVRDEYLCHSIQFVNEKEIVIDNQFFTYEGEPLTYDISNIPRSRIIGGDPYDCSARRDQNRIGEEDSQSSSLVVITYADNVIRAIPSADFKEWMILQDTCTTNDGMK